MSELKNKKVVKESGGFNGNFLTLAPPREERPSSYLSHHCQEVPDFDALPYKVRHKTHLYIKLYLGYSMFIFILMALKYRDSILVKTLLDFKFQDTVNEQVKWSELGRSIQQPFYNFLPASSAANGLPAGTANSNGKQAEAVDLNLKL